MLTRLYIDNFRCFVNFEYRPARRQLILGSNGAGKSSLLDALFLLRQFATRGDRTDDFFTLNQRTRWMDQAQQIFELELALDRANYVYRLVIDSWGDPPRPRVVSETVHFDAKPIFEFVKGEVHLYNDRFEHKVTYPFDWHRSALATINERRDNQILSRFKGGLTNILCFRVNPFVISPRTEGEDLAPNINLSNLAAWYRHLVQADPKQNAALLRSLGSALDGFSFLELAPVGENARVLLAEFTASSGPSRKFGFGELSDGQRCLICLYVILHFLLAKGNTIILDEPDNFVSLREIQPWLQEVTDTVDEGHGQILLISHHPEILNQWAPTCGVNFIRDDAGPVRVEEFHGDPASSLTPAEIVARGWERE